jgi:hypothetical protein
METKAIIAETSRPILEVVNGVPICRRVRRPGELRAGDRGRLAPNEPVVVVDRVTDCAAYVHKVYDPPVRREIPDGLGGTRVILVGRGPVEPGISRRSPLYPE